MKLLLSSLLILAIIAGIDSAFAGGAVYDAMRSEFMMQTIMKTIVPPAAMIGTVSITILAFYMRRKRRMTVA